jgi:hypothetical protein
MKLFWGLSLDVATLCQQTVGKKANLFGCGGVFTY